MKIFIDVLDNARLVWVSSSTRTCRQCGPLTSTGYTKRHVTRDVKVIWDINQILEPIWNLIFLDDYNILDSLPKFPPLIFYLCPSLCQTLIWVPATLVRAGDQSLLIYCDSLDSRTVTTDGPHDNVTCHVSRSSTTPESLWTGWMSASDCGTHSVTITR